MTNKKTTTAPAYPAATRRRAAGRRAVDVVQGTWSSSLIFVLAVIGAAIGLNTFWQFPYLAVHNGGGVFLLVFLASLLLVALPALMAEIVIGRRAGTLPAAAVRHLVAQDECKPGWIGLGGLVTVTGFLIFAYLCVVGGWTWAYAVRTAVGAFDGKTLDGTLSQFFTFSGDPEKQLFWHAAFLLSTVGVVGRGVNLGLEPMIRYGVPAMLMAIVGLTAYGLIAGDAAQAASSLFRFQPELFDYKSLFVAVAESVFCTGIGMGAVMAYGSYLKPGASIAGTSLAISGLVVVVALLASLFVLSVLYATGQKAMPGPAMLFQALPYALARLTGGAIAGTVMYLTLGAAAWFSAIALIQAAVGWLRSFAGLSDFRATVLIALAAWALGVVVILSFNYWAFPFRLFGAEKRLGIFDIVQVLTSDLFIPLGVLLAALFASWGLDQIAVRKELDLHWPGMFPLWLYLGRGFVPLSLLVLLYYLPSLFR